MERDGTVMVRTLPYAFCLMISILTIALKPLRVEDCICEWKLSPPLPCLTLQLLVWIQAIRVQSNSSPDLIDPRENNPFLTEAELPRAK